MVVADVLCAKLRVFGCELLLERFSYGLGAYAFLRANPPQHLSVDSAHISAVRTSAPHRHSATGVVNLAEGLSVRTIATGVLHRCTRWAAVSP